MNLPRADFGTVRRAIEAAGGIPMTLNGKAVLVGAAFAEGRASWEEGERVFEWLGPALGGELTRIAADLLARREAPDVE